MTNQENPYQTDTSRADAFRSFAIRQWVLAMVYPLLGLVLNGYHDGFWDPLWLRLAISSIAAALLIAAHYRPFSTKQIHYSGILTYMLITAHSLLLAGINLLTPVYAIGVIIILGLGHVIFNEIRKFIIFSAFYLLSIAFIIFFIPDSTAIDSALFFGVVSAISGIGLVHLLTQRGKNVSSELASLIADNFNEGILVVSMDDTTKYANSKIAEMLGYEVKDFIGKDVKSFLASEKDRQTVVGKTDTRTNRISDKYELDFRHRSGRIVNTEVSGNPTYNQKGKPTGSVSIITDITERKEAEEKLERLSLVASKTENYVIITDEKDLIVWVNEGFERITGYSLTEISGKQPKAFLRGKATDPAAVKRIDEGQNSAKPFYDEIQNYTKEGDTIWLSLNVTPLVNGDGEVTGYITIGNDITTRKEAEENLKQKAFRLSIIREIDQAIIASETLPVLVNSTIENVIKLLPECHEVSLSLNGDSGYKTIASVNDISTPKYLPSKVQSILDIGYPYLVSNIKKLRKPLELDQELQNADFNAYVFLPLIYGDTLLGTLNVFWRDKHPKIAEDVEMLESVARDVAISIKQFSLQRTLASKNRELKSNLRELKSTHEELQSFSYIVSHDLKAPLRAISSLADWLIKDYAERLDEQGKKYLDLLVSRTHRMHNLIDGTLQYSRIGRKNVEKAVINTEEVVENVLYMLSADPNITFNVQKALPAVYYNTVQLQQVFQNLISNAIKFMDKDNGIIEIGFTEKSGMFEFFVKDNGPGVDARHHEKVFKIFQTLSPRDESENTGIGLTIVKKIVELNEGEVWMESSLEEGSIFYFSVPKTKVIAKVDDDKIKEKTHE